MQKPWTVEVVRCTNEWANGCWDDNEMKEPMHSPLNEPMEPRIQRINESEHQWVNKSTNQWFSESMSQWINVSAHQRINESMNQRVNVAVSKWVINQWISESTKKWTNEPRNQCINETSNQQINQSTHFANLILQKCSGRFSFCDFDLQTEFSLQSRARVLPTWFAEVLRTCQFYRFSKEIELSLPSGAHFADVIFQNCHVPAARNSCLIKIELSWQSRALFGQQRGPQSQKQRPYMTLVWRPQEPHYPQKTHKVRAQECFPPWIHTLPNCDISHLLDDGWLTCWRGWRDDVVDMMVWMLTMTIVRNSEVY